MIAVVGMAIITPGHCGCIKHGFEVVGQRYAAWATKGDWRDTVIMQRPLNDGDWTLPE